MILLMKINRLFSEMATGKRRVRNRWIRGRERDRERESRLKKWEKEHKEEPKMARVVNDHWKWHLRIWGSTEQTNVNQIG
jgi:hypothetical protein